MSNKVNLSDLYPLLRETLDGGGTFSLTITGTSMYPFILGNRDKVTLSPIPKELRKNDLPLYRRDDGAFVLHRIVKIESDGTYTCCGDHQWQVENGLRQDQMIAVASAYERKGRHLTNRNLLYRMYRTVWTWVLKYRWIFFRVQNLPARIRKRLEKMQRN